MDTSPDHLDDGPTRPPHDVDEERQRLLRDAAAHGVDPAAAEAVAERLAHTEPAADAYRAVDRRIAAGYDLESTEEILTGGGDDGQADQH